MAAHGFGVFVLHHAEQNMCIGFAQLCRFGQGAENTDVAQRQLRLGNIHQTQAFEHQID